MYIQGMTQSIPWYDCAQATHQFVVDGARERIGTTRGTDGQGRG